MQLRSFHDYVQGSVQMGMGLGIVSLIARWVTGSTILSSPEAMVKYGVFGGIVYALIGMIALFMFSFIGKKVRQDFPVGLTMGDYLKTKLHPVGYWTLMMLLILTSLNTLFIQGMVAASLCQFLFDAPLYVGLFFFFVFCVLYAGFGGIKWIHGIAVVQVFFMFAAVILIPVYFFVREGIQPVYDGIRLYHPYMLFLNKDDLWAFLIAGLFVAFGQFFFDLTSWQRLFMMETKKITLTFSLSGLIWFIFPLSFSSLIIIVIFTGGFNDIQSILEGLAIKITTPFFFILFVLCAFSAITSTFGACLHSLISLLVTNVLEPFQREKNDLQKMKMAYLLAIGIGGFLWIATLFYSQSPFELLFYSGNIYSALLAPILTIVFSRGKAASYIPISAVIGIIGSFMMQPFANNFQSIWFSGIISFAIIMICTIYHAVNLHWKSR